MQMGSNWFIQLAGIPRAGFKSQISRAKTRLMMGPELQSGPF
jgi:hypothetical protein